MRDPFGVERRVADGDRAAERDPAERDAIDAGVAYHVLELADEEVEPLFGVDASIGSEVSRERVGDHATARRQRLEKPPHPLPAPLQRLHDDDHRSGPLVEHCFDCSA